MTAAILLVVFYCEVAAIINILEKNNHLIRKSKQRVKPPGQKFGFKSIMWATVTALLTLEIIILVCDWHHIITVDSMWNDKNQYLYYLLLLGLVLVMVMNVIIASIITGIGFKCDELIELPKLLPFKNKVIVVIFHFLFVMTELLTMVLLGFHGCGIILAVLVNPVQVFATTALSIMIILFFLFKCTYIYEKGENMKQCSDCENMKQCSDCENMKQCSGYKNMKQCCGCFVIILKIVLCFSFVAFLALFGNIYLNVILFAGTEKSGVLSSLAQIFPAILLTFIGWLVKKEYDNFTGKNVEFELSTFKKKEVIVDTKSHTFKDSQM